MKLTSTIIGLIIAVAANCQPFAKALEQIQATAKLKKPAEKVEFYDKAEQILLKAYQKDSLHPLLNYSMSILYGMDDFSRKDYFRSWKYFVQASNALDKIKPDEYEWIKAYYQVMNSRRRNKTPEENFEIEKAELEDKLIRFVREENNYDMAVRFLNEFPGSKFTQNVIHIRNYLAFRNVEKSASVEQYNQFIKTYPDAAQIPQAIKQRDEIAYKQAQSLNTFDAFNEFIHLYKGSVFENEAIKKRDFLAFEKARTLNTLEAMDDFLIQYPEAADVPNARKIKRNLMFERAKKINSIEAFNDFISKYPDGEQYVDVFNLKATAVGNNFSNKVENLQPLWFKGFDNGSDIDAAKGLLVLQNHILVAGKSYRDDKLKTDAWLIWLDFSGKMIQNRFLGETGFDTPLDMIFAGDENIILCGQLGASSDSIFDGKAWMLSLKEDGKINWSRTFKVNMLDHIGYAASFLYAGGYISDTSGLIYPYIVKTNSDGKKIWDRSYTKQGRINALSATANGSTVFTTGSWIAMINPDGYLVWEKMFADSINCTMIRPNVSGNLVFGGYTNSGQFYYLETDITGKPVKEQFYYLPAGQTVDQMMFNEQVITIITSDQQGEMYFNELSDDKLMVKSTIHTLSGRNTMKRIIPAKDGKYILFGDKDLIVIKVK